MKYDAQQLRDIFQSHFDLRTWTDVLKNLFNASALRSDPKLLTPPTDKEQGYFIGHVETADSFNVGFFHYRIYQNSVTHKRVGLRQLVRSFVNANIGLYDAALVVFESNNDWRLSFICDIKEEATAPRRFTYVFGDPQNYYNTPVSRFLELQERGISFNNIKEAFSVEALTKQFYKDLFDWYQWAIDEETGITFPNNTAIEDDDREKIDVKIIRMITRLMFVWFIKQKQLVPNSIFDITYLQTILKDFDPCSKTNGNYYNAILQNLFFATLNRAIIDEDGRGRGFAHLQGAKDLKSLYRYAEMFTISEEEVIQLFAEVPFLNGGLFECLDKTRTLDGVERAYNYDGFSRNEARFADGRYRNRAFVPNILFFEPEHGLFSILSRYNFTIEENTPNEQQVALDPELLGKVFENLLGAYNPETKETARNQSGSFYTPREIVNYMVDESLKAYLGAATPSSPTSDKTTKANGDEGVAAPTVLSLFSDDFVYDPAHEAEYQQIASRLRTIKVLDPACGSGAFPMGCLGRMVDILQKIHPATSTYELKLQIIENCIYGSDIQSIAAQISKLRFFISLICDCEKDSSKPNFGIPTLPNLETKFVAANTLLQKKRVQQHSLFEDPEIEPTKQELADVRHRHFSAKSASTKRRLRDKDQELRLKLARLLAQNDCFAPEDAKQLAAWNPYDQNTVAEFFDPEWMFGVKDGFDIVIGNPPYIQLQNNGGELAKLYEPCGYKTFARTGDIYCLFYERGQQLLKRGGHLCYITSNKWMRAGYGEKTRQFFATQTDPQLLIDFAGVKIFESATVDTNILLFARADNQHNTLCAVMRRSGDAPSSKAGATPLLSSNIGGTTLLSSTADGKSKAGGTTLLSSTANDIGGTTLLSSHSGKSLPTGEIRGASSLPTGEVGGAFVTQDFASSDSWVILSPIEQSIKRKIEAIGTPLKDWDIQINYGIKTGCNEAFIIDTAKREEILANCQTEEERQRTAELIRPILRGRDIKRYGYEWAGLYLIATFPSRHYDIEQYPAVKQYLLSFGIERLEQTGKTHVINGEKIKARKKTNNKWFETQDSISYWGDFLKPKIIYPNMTKYMPFYYDEKGFFQNDKSFMITGKGISFLTAFLNSSLFKFCFIDNFPELQGGTRELRKIFFDKIPVVKVNEEQEEKFHAALLDIQQSYTKQKAIAIDTMIFDLYGLTAEERNAIGFVDIK